MKKYIKLSIIFINSALLLSSVNAENYKIAAVNMDSLFNSYYRKDIEKVALDETRERIKSENSERLATLNELRDELIKLGKVVEDPTAAAEVKKEVATEYKVKLDTLRNMEKKFNDVATRHNRILQIEAKAIIKALREEIAEVVVSYAKNEEYDYVFH